MEEMGGGGGGGEGKWWWAAASTGQLGLGINMSRRGYSGGSHLMPLKAFGVASLFVGAAASASVSLLRSCGIYSVEDMKEVGRNTKKWIRNSSKVTD